MNFEDHLKKMKKIQSNLLSFINDDIDIEEKYQNIKSLFDDQKICENCIDIISVLQLLVDMVNNIHREQDFFSKIEKILLIFEKDIKKHLTNSEIFDLFKSNKRLLLFLVERGILVFDKQIVDLMISIDKNKEQKLLHYFFNKIKEYLSQELVDQITIENQENYQEKRKIGENDSKICQLIQKDLIDEFITYVNRNNYSLNLTVEKSIFETNSYLIDKTPTLIEYAAFFGSIQIFKYLYLNKVDLTPSLWIYAIHGNNPELIHLLEQNKIECSYKNIFRESIKCFHNDIAEYIFANYIKNNESDKKENLKESDDDENEEDENEDTDDDDDDESDTWEDESDYDDNDDFNDYNDILLPSLKYHNFFYIQNNFSDQIDCFIVSKYNHISLLELLLKNKQIDINTKKCTIKRKGKLNCTALFVAIEKGNIFIVDLLLKNENIDVNIINTACTKKTEEKTALHLAIEKGEFETVNKLLQNKNIDVNINKTIKKSNRKMNSSRNETALTIAVKKGQSEIVRVLLECKNIDVNSLQTVKVAPTYEYANEKEEDTDYETTISTVKKTALYIAVKKENIEIVKLLLAKENIDVNLSYNKDLTYKEESNKDQMGWSYCEYYSLDKKEANINI